jgi:lysylphosphatidylglycerol synthetase-like protein (DUF2156 family)
MDLSKILELLSFTIPAIITGLVAMYFFKTYTDNEDKRRSFRLRMENQKQSLPLRLQAYERLTLFLERISLNKLLIRIKPVGKDPDKYSHQLISIVEQEFEHNLAQQIYVSETAWKAVVTSKNLIIKIIRSTSEKKEVETAEQLREDILNNLAKNEGPTSAAISYLKIEVKKIF